LHQRDVTELGLTSQTMVSACLMKSRSSACHSSPYGKSRLSMVTEKPSLERLYQALCGLDVAARVRNENIYLH
jgi:hypothetical protein